MPHLFLKFRMPSKMARIRASFQAGPKTGKGGDLLGKPKRPKTVKGGCVIYIPASPAMYRHFSGTPGEGGRSWSDTILP